MGTNFHWNFLILVNNNIKIIDLPIMRRPFYSIIFSKQKTCTSQRTFRSSQPNSKPSEPVSEQANQIPVQINGLAAQANGIPN